MSFLSKFGGSLISGAANVFGGLLGSRAANKASSAATESAQRQAQLQQEFAQQGVRWRVEDAKKAGIHPLYALGASVPTYSPVSQSFDQSSPWSSAVQDFGRNLGQDIRRSQAATSTRSERFQQEMMQLQLTREQLNNDLLRAQIQRMHQVGPPFPGDTYSSAIPGQEGNMPVGKEVYKVVPPEVASTKPGLPSQAAGVHPDTIWSRSQGGFKAHANPDVYQEQDITSPDYAEYWLRNRVSPSFGARWFGNAPPDSYLPKGATGWIYRGSTGEYVPAYGRHWLWNFAPNFIPRRSLR